MPYDPDERFELEDAPEDVLKKLLGSTESETQDEDEQEGDETEP